MKEVLKSRWNHTLHENDEGYYLNIVCGGVAIYETSIQLTQNEISKYQDNPEFLEILSDDVRQNREKYEDRIVKPV